MRKFLFILSILCISLLSFGEEVNTLDKSYTGNKIKELNFSLVNGKINIIPSEDDILRIHMVSKDKIRYIEKKDIKSHKYYVEIKSLKEKTWFHSEGEIDVTISVPINNDKKINIDAVNSKTDITSVKSSLKIKLVNGNIDIKNLDGDFFAETVNAPIHIDGVTGTTQIETVNGKINGTNLNKIGNMENVRGSITLIGNELLEDSQLETVVGSIDLNVNKIGGRNNITTVIGGVSLKVKNLKDINKYDEVYNFDGKNVNIETTIGKIKVNN